jgi:kynurenine formamidase
LRYQTKCTIILAAALAVRAQAPDLGAITKAEFERLMKELSNWGRWGKDDQLGTVNLITPAKRKSAAALVKEGHSVSLSRDLDTEKSVDNPSPFAESMSPPVDGQFNMDEYRIFFHGFAHTHLDALSHVFYEGKMYNGFPETAVKPGGTEALAVGVLGTGIFTRGVLVDIPRLKGLPYLENDAVITPEDLDAWEKQTGVRVESGDVVLIRTGRWARRDGKGPWDIGANSAGLSARCARWLKSRNIAMLGGDAASDALPSRIPGVSFPIHQLMLVAMGTPMLDQCQLEELAKECASLKRWTFLFTVAPLRVKGGTGSPVNPIATF